MPSVSPEKLDVDAIELDEQTKSDPFTEKRLRTLQTATGWIVYSVGPDLTDGGGAINVGDGGDDIGHGPVE